MFYRPVWRKSVRNVTNPEKTRSAASWLIFADAKGVGVALARRLEATGHHCHLVYRNHAFAQRGHRTWTVNERQPRDFRRLLEQFTDSEALSCDGVIYLWGLDAPSIEDLTLAALKSGSEMMCRGALAILQALAETRSTNPAGRRLWLVTANTQKIEGQSQHVDPVQATLWGLGRTAAIEYPGIWGGLIDLQLNADCTPDVDLLAVELLQPDGETQIAIAASGERYIQRFVTQSLDQLPAQRPRVRGDATYLVTGGLGMLGRSVVTWLMSSGARHLVLTGRNASTEAAQELISTAHNSGVSIKIVAADISRQKDVSRLIRTIGNECPPLKGVVHSAGVLDDGILAQLDWDRFTHVFEPKVYGSWLLHECTKSLKLDFFVLQSSLLSLLGSAGQANYSAGNSFLDSLATHRRSVGLPATAINWSAWSEGGLATRSGARGEAMWSSLGVKFVSPDLAMQGFDRLMQRDVDQIAVAIADWSTYAGKVGKPPFLAELVNASKGNGSSKAARKMGGPAASPALVNGEARQQIFGRLQQRIMTELGFAEPIDPDRPLNEIGLDSLRSVTLANNLEDEFGILVSISELISGPTINQLSDHLSGLLARRSKDDAVEFHSTMPPVAAIRVLAKHSPIAVEQVDSELALSAHEILHVPTSATGIANGRVPGGEELQVANVYGPEETAIGSAENRNGNGSLVYFDAGTNGKMPLTGRSDNGARTDNSGVVVVRSTGEVASRHAGKWLIAPQPNPNAKARLFCFPYAGGGLVSFRAWAELFGDTVEVVAVEAPGRGTRINETPVDDLDTFVERLLPEMADWLDRPSAFFGHCLGGLTMFAMLRALPDARSNFIKHAFACGVRPPHLLKRKGEFEDNVVYDMMLNREFDMELPLYAQTDEIFVDIIRQFDTPAANRMLEIPRLRNVLLPTIRAEFEMAYKYEYQPVEPFSFPISSFVGDADPWVSEGDSAGWGTYTCGGFRNHVRKGSHFLMAEDGQYIRETINNEFVNLVA
ncbi:MAG TPA: SDR family NAD(P)-dependent oxidoreductase [Lacipirellulaceae bacterium]